MFGDFRNMCPIRDGRNGFGSYEVGFGLHWNGEGPYTLDRGEDLMQDFIIKACIGLIGGIDSQASFPGTLLS